MYFNTSVGDRRFIALIVVLKDLVKTCFTFRCSHFPPPTVRGVEDNIFELGHVWQVPEARTVNP